MNGLWALRDLMSQDLRGEGPPWEEGVPPSAVYSRVHVWLQSAVWQSQRQAWHQWRQR